jgi:hypothetical protein
MLNISQIIPISGKNYTLLTYSMVQNPSWEANWFAASQEIPRILWNPKVHHRTHKNYTTYPNLHISNAIYNVHQELLYNSSLRA